MDDQEAAQAAEAWLADPTPPPLAPGAQAQINLNAAKATGQTPDFAAESRRLAAEIGVPEYTAQQAPDAVRQRSFEMGLTGLTIAAPKTTRFLGDPGKAAIVADSIDNLVAVEHAAGAPILYFETDKGRAEARVTPDGKTYFDGQDFTGAANSFKFVRPVYGSAGAQQTGTPGAAIDGLPERAPTIGSYAKGLAVQFEAGITRSTTGAKLQIADALNLDAAYPGTNARLMRDYAGAQLLTDVYDPTFKSGTAKGVYSGLASLAQQAPGLGLSLLLRDPAPALAAAGIGVQTDAYGKYRTRGGTPGAALLGSVAEGGVEVATEMLPMEHIVGAFGQPGKKALSEFLIGMGLDIPGEQIATFAQDAIDTAIANPDKTWAQFAAERPDAAYQTLIATVTQGGVMSALHLGARRLGEQPVAEETATRLETLDKLATASPLRERDPKAFEEFVASVVQDGGDSVYVDAQTFAQAAQDAPPEEQAILQGMASMQNLAEAAATGQDLKVPVAEFAARLAGTSLGKAIIENGRSNPFELSRAQAAEAQATQGEALQAEAAKVLASAQADDAFKASSQAVHDNLVEQLKQTNRFTPDVNKAYASNVTAFYTVNAAKMGITPEQLYAQYPLQIKAQEAVGSAPLRQQPEPIAKPPVDAAGNVVLSHWGKKGKLKNLDPARWGDNWEVLSDEEKSQVLSDGPRRIYFGIGVGQPGGYTPEFGLGLHRYETSVPANKLYDYRADPKKFAAKAKKVVKQLDDTLKPGDGFYEEELTKAFDQLVQDAGYLGFFDKDHPAGMVASLFAKTKVEYRGKDDGQAFHQRAVMGEPLDGAPATNEPYAEARRAAADYMRQASLQFSPPTVYVKVDVARAKRIADAFEAMKHDPENPEVKAAYAAMIAETLAQWQAIKATGIKIEFIDFAKTGDPYAESPRQAIEDVRQNNHLWVFPTDDGFGSSDADISGNPLLALTDEYIGDRQLKVNDVFRIVHDYFGHIKDGNGFRAGGEENAWQSHASMYSPLARRAMTVETRGQNSWVNYGPHGETNRTATAADTVYADQKIGLLPEWVSEEGYVGGANSGLPIGGTFAQAATPTFYSALARAVENSPTKRASAAQWLATLSKTPGVKQEEIEWTGVGEWLKLQEGQVEREDLSRFLAENGVQLDEVVQQALKINQGSQYLFPAVSFAITGAGTRDRMVLQLENDADAYRVLSKQDALHDEDGNLRDDWAEVVVDDLLGGSGDQPARTTQFDDYKLPGADETYKELLITLPKIDGPSTHWDVSNVVAHARITERKSADGKRVLFLEEVQSDWHQKGRDQGYKGDASAEEKAAAELALQQASTEHGEARDAYLSLVREAIYAQADYMEQGAKKHFDKPNRNPEYDEAAQGQLDAAAEMRSRVGAGLSVQGAGAYLSRYGIAFTPALTEGLQRYNTSRLRLDEAYQAEAATAGGIPDAPFRKTWSALVMKRMIRYAVDNGFEQIAWINGNQQNGGTTGGDGSFFYERNLVNVTNDLLKKYGAKVEKTVRLKGVNTETKSSPEFATAFAALQKATDSLRALSVRDPLNGEAELTRRAAELRSAVPPENFSEQDKAEVSQRYLATADALEAGIPLIQKWRDALAAYKAAEPTSKVFQVPANFGFTITPELATAASAGLPLFQNGEDRGSFDPSTNTINLLRRADLSTFLHETGHFYLNVLADIASRPDAPAGIATDMDAVLRWFGVPDLATWRSMSLDQQRPHHEKFARGFEAYLFEGKAPSLKMRELFQKFRSWLKNVYQSLTALNVELDDEVRGVFDRMLASADEIKQAEDARAFAPLFATKPEGMTTDEWTEYQRLGQQATADAADELETRSLRDMKWLSNAKSRALKALQKDALAKRQAVRAEVETEVQAEPVYRAQAYLKKGELDGAPVSDARKLSIPALKAMHEGVAPELQDWTALGYGKYGMLAEDGMTPDEAAELFGFDSGGQLVDALLSAEPINDKIKGLTDQRMLERYGDLTDPATLARAAEQAVHNEARIRFVAAELNALAKGLGKPSILNAAVKEYAAGIIARLPIKELRPHRYTAAGLRAAKASEKALSKGNQTEALAEKRNQLINIQAARAAWDARAEVDKGMALFARIARAKDDNVSRSRNMDLVNAARAIMAAYGLGRAKNDPLGYMQALKRYDVDLFNDIEPFVTSATANPKPVEQLTYEEFLGLRDTVNQLWTLARRSKVIEIDGKQLEIDTVTAELGQRLDVLGVPDRNIDRAPTDGERKLRQLSGLRAATRRVEHWAQLLGKPFTRYIWNPVSDAADAYRAEKAVYMAKFLDLLKPIAPTLKPVKIAATEIGYTFSGKSELLHAILHTGNLSNKTKLLVGRKWGSLTPDGVLNSARWEAFVDRMHAEKVLTKADWDFAQRVWDLLEETKPLAQRAHHTMYGRYFAEVTADEVVTPFGNYAGGYVPALTDAFLVQDAALRAEAEAVEGGDHSMFPSPTKGFTQGRVEAYNRELALDLRLLPQHIDKVLKFSHLGPPVRDVLRLLKAKGFSAKLEKFDPVAQGELLLPWLNRAVRQTVSTPMKGEAGRMADAFFKELRKRTGLQIMFGNIVNAIQQFTGFSVSLVKVKPTHLRAALWQYMRQPTELAEAIASVSPFMAERMASQTFEINQAIDDIVLDPSKLDQTRAFFNRHGYFLQHAFQNVVDITTWQGAYDQAQAGGMNHAEAVREANAAVRQTQGAMNAEDLARVEAGNAVFRLFTQFSTYFNNMANLLGTEFAGTIRDAGFKGAPRLVYVYFTVFAVPALLSDLLVRAMRGEGDDEDDGWMDEFLDWFFGAQFRTLTAMIPVVGPGVQAAVNTFNSKPYDDRIANSPALAALESAARAPKSVYAAATGDGSAKRAVKDTLTAVGLATGLPVAVIGKPVGYALDVADGKTKPTGPVDAARGAVSGTGPPHF